MNSFSGFFGGGGGGQGGGGHGYNAPAANSIFIR
tara:strand:- start:507 stop:608 length:102 start_codon:yes stop_codon:yes gene_type:complete